MKKIIILLSFLAISASSQYAMESVSLEIKKETTILLQGPINQEQIKVDTPACSSALIHTCEQLKHKIWPENKNVRASIHGISLGLLTFSGLETLFAIAGSKTIAGSPTALVVNGCISLVVSFIYIGTLMEWRCNC